MSETETPVTESGLKVSPENQKAETGSLDLDIAKEVEATPTKPIAAIKAAEKDITDQKLNVIRSFINSQVAESKLPVEGETSYAIYGGKLTEDPEGKLVYDMRLRHVNHDIDRAGDRFLRSVEDHQVKRPLKTFLRNPVKFFNFVPTLMPFVLTKPKAMRYRGEKFEILDNVHRLGLDDYYGAHKWGIEYRKPEVLKGSYPLQDILRSYELSGRGLDQIDRFDAIQKTGKLLADTHREYGAVGEFNAYAVLFKGVRDGKAVEPYLNLPTIIYNKEKQLGEKMKRATDLLDLVVSVGSEEWHRDKNLANVKKAMYYGVTPYDDEDVIKMTISLIKRGRLTLPGDEKVAADLTHTARIARKVFSLHNQQRLGIKSEASRPIRDLALEVVEAKLRAIQVQKRNQEA